MNNCILFFLIGCATIIAIVAIVFGYLTNRQCNNTTEHLLSQKIIKIHRNYICGILSSAIIFLLTSKYGAPNNNIFEYLSFGSTLTSMVLSILAIFVTVQSSSDLYKQFARMEDATNTITSVSNNIQETLNKITQAGINLNSTSENLNDQINRIIEEVDHRVKTYIHETESNLSTQIGQQYSQQNLSSNKATTEPAPQNMHTNDELIDNYLKTISNYGLFAHYACALSLKHNKMFNLPELFGNSKDYVYGVLISSVSAQIIDIDSEERIIKCNKSLITEEAISKELNYRRSNSKTHQKFDNIVTSIKTYFNEPSDTDAEEVAEVIKE